MSIVIIKVDKKAKTHSIFSDGILVRGESKIWDDHKNKIRHVEIDGHSILIGTCGYGVFSRYLRLNLPDKIKDIDSSGLSDKDSIENILIEIYSSMWKEFCDKHQLKYTSEDSDAIISIDGVIIELSTDANRVANASILDDAEYHTIGQDAQAANIMLDLGIEAGTIIRAISKRNCYVNENVMSITNVKYQ